MAATEINIKIRLQWWCLPLVKACCFVLRWLPLVSPERKMKVAYAVCGWLTTKAVWTKEGK